MGDDGLLNSEESENFRRLTRGIVGSLVALLLSKTFFLRFGTQTK